MKAATRAAGSFHAVTALLIVLALHLPTARAAGQGQRVVYEGTVAVAVEDDFARGRATRRCRYWLPKNRGIAYPLTGGTALTA